MPFLSLIFSGLLGGLRRIASAVGALLSKLNAQGVIGLVAGLLLAFAWFHSASAARHWRKDSAQWEKKFRAEKIEFAKLVASYRDAQVKAKALNDAQIAAITAKRQHIDERTTHALSDNLAALRGLSAGGKLRPGGATDQGAAHSTAPGTIGQGATGTAGPPGLCLSSSKLLLAAENEERHDRLIDWAEGQGAVDPNAP